MAPRRRGESSSRRDGPRLGQPLCPDCHDYAGHVVWNNQAISPHLAHRKLAAVACPIRCPNLVAPVTVSPAFQWIKDVKTTSPARTMRVITANLARHAGPALGSAVLVPPTVTVAIPETFCDRLPTVPRTMRCVTILVFAR